MIKLAILGGGTGLSSLLRGFKKLPFDISAIVSVCDDGSSTGRLREEFHTPAVGDIRKVMISLSSDEENAKRLLDYRFKTSSDLNGHALGNLLLTRAADICGSISGAIELINSMLDLKGKVIPLSEDDVTLMGEMEDGEIVSGEHNITECDSKIKRVFYKGKPLVNEDVLLAIREADAIILSMGSIFTSIIPNLLCDEIIREIDNSSAKLIYMCNLMTQPGETDDFKVSDHINLINSYLGKRKIDAVFLNNGEIDSDVLKKYETAEQKDLVLADMEKIELLGTEAICNDYISIDDGYIRHNTLRLAIDVISYLLD